MVVCLESGRKLFVSGSSVSYFLATGDLVILSPRLRDLKSGVLVRLDPWVFKGGLYAHAHAHAHAHTHTHTHSLLKQS